MQTLIKQPKQALYKVGQTFNIIGQTITIISVYPPGHKRASHSQYFYLINSSDCGEDVWNEQIMTQIINEYQK